jgi:hypothetical protein
MCITTLPYLNFWDRERGLLMAGLRLVKMVEVKSSYIGGHPERAIPRKDWK